MNERALGAATVCGRSCSRTAEILNRFPISAARVEHRSLTVAALKALAVAALAAGCAHAAIGERPAVLALSFEGNRSVPSREIASRIVTSAPSWNPFADLPVYDELVFEADLKRIERLYRARGFHKSRVAPEVAATSGEVRIRIGVDEGPPTLLDRVDVRGLAELSDEERQQVLGRDPLRPGDLFDEDRYDAFKAQLDAELKEIGFAEAEVSGRVTVDPATDRAAVEFDAAAGRRYRFGAVFVAGVDCPRPRVGAPPPRCPVRERVVAETAYAAESGQPYRESALTEAQRRVFDVGLFAAVRVTRGAADRGEGTVPIVTAVRQAPDRTLRARLGVAVDPKRQQLRAGGDFIHRNLFGSLQRLEATLNVGVAALPTVWDAWSNPDKRGVLGSLRLTGTWPGIVPRVDAVVAVEAERGFEDAFRFNAGRGSVGLTWRADRRFTVTPLSYHLEFYDITGTVAQAARGTGLAGNCAGQEGGCHLVLSYVESRLTFDGRDSPIEPTRGVVLALSLQAGGGPLQGDFAYLRALPELRGYLPIGPAVLALRLRYGVLLHGAVRESPIVSRFFLGGATSIRSFGSRRLSPRALVPAPGPPVPLFCEAVDPTCRDPGRYSAEAVPVGGNGMAEGMLDVRLRVSENVVLAIPFIDVGEVTEEAPALLAKPSFAVGAGVRYQSPIGPARLDVAVLLPFGRAVACADGPAETCPAPPESWFGINLLIGEAF